MTGALLGLLLLLAGVVALERGSDWFVDSAAALARRSRLPLALVGLLTVGVEWEELAVVLVALAEGTPRLAFGAVVGAAIANLTLVLAAGVGFRPLASGPVERRLALIVVAATALVAALALRGAVDRPAGGLLLAAFGAYGVWLARRLRSVEELPALDDDDDDAARSRPRLALLTVAGLVLALVGGELAVRGALRLAGAAGLSETVAGLTLVALGTSVPDIAISLAAARRDAPSLVVANAAGSNLCNLLLLLGLVALVEPVPIPASVVAFDLPLLVAVTLLFAWAILRGRAGRAFALTLAAIYLAYLAIRLLT